MVAKSVQTSFGYCRLLLVRGGEGKGKIRPLSRAVTSFYGREGNIVTMRLLVSQKRAQSTNDQGSGQPQSNKHNDGGPIDQGQSTVRLFLWATMALKAAHWELVVEGASLEAGRRHHQWIRLPTAARQDVVATAPTLPFALLCNFQASKRRALLVEATREKKRSVRKRWVWRRWCGVAFG